VYTLQSGVQPTKQPTKPAIIKVYRPKHRVTDNLSSLATYTPPPLAHGYCFHCDCLRYSEVRPKLMHGKMRKNKIKQRTKQKRICLKETVLLVYVSVSVLMDEISRLREGFMEKVASDSSYIHNREQM